MKWKLLYHKLRFYLQYFPFTTNALVLGLSFWIGYNFIFGDLAISEGEENVFSFRLVILLMIRIAFGFAVALVSVSIISSLFCWIHYLYLKWKHKYLLELAFTPTKKAKGLYLQSQIKGVRRPFLGFIKGRLIYGKGEMTDKFILASNKKGDSKRFWREAVTGQSRMELPDIKEYDINGGFVFFEDMLRLISLPVLQRINGHFYQPPVNTKLEEKDVSPKKTEEPEYRIEELKRVNGEYLNYKDYETGDDVRRIVWKVYAKNRELVVRTPEIMDPYASQIYFYASFFTDLNQANTDSAYALEMMNYYKNRIWSTFETLVGKDIEVKFIPDQDIHINEQLNQRSYVQRLISNCNWQSDFDLNDYFRPNYASVLCISSFSHPKDVADVLEYCGSDTVVYYVKLSNAFKHFLFWPWIKRIFVLPPDDRLRRIRSRWILTPFRLKVLKREKAIEKVLHDSSVVVGEL